MSATNPGGGGLHIESTGVLIANLEQNPRGTGRGLTVFCSIS